MNKPIQIAIDGPVGAGKGTVAVILRNRVQGTDIYTGGTYRAVALYCVEHSINMDIPADVIDALSHIHVEVENDSIFLNGVNVSEDIKGSKIANATPKIAAIREVRDAMISVQHAAVEREMKKNNNIIVEGRDIGTNILPNADLKVFLTADSMIRAKRRSIQLKKYGEHIDLEKVRQEVDLRDKTDLERDNDPLAKEPKSMGYFVVDNSYQSPDETVEVILNEMQRRNLL